MIKVENWNGYEIRFVDVDGKWWAVLADICAAVGLQAKWVKLRLSDEVVSNNHIPDSLGREQNMIIVNEKGIYKTVFQSRKPEAEDFQNWVYDVLIKLRKATGLEGFEVFRMLDKEQQREAMNKLHQSLKAPTKVSYIKANTIADKAVSNIFGLPKMIKKEEMTPEMLVKRQEVLDNTVELMTIKDKYGFPDSISQKIYEISQ